MHAQLVSIEAPRVKRKCIVQAKCRIFMKFECMKILPKYSPCRDLLIYTYSRTVHRKKSVVLCWPAFKKKHDFVAWICHKAHDIQSWNFLPTLIWSSLYPVRNLSCLYWNKNFSTFGPKNYFYRKLGHSYLSKNML